MWQMSDEVLLNENKRLDSSGSVTSELKLPSSAKPYGRIRFETSVSDDSGRKTSAFSTAQYYNADYFVGVRTEGWTARAGSPVEIEYVVSDKNSETVENVPVLIEFNLRKTCTFGNARQEMRTFRAI